MEVTFPILITFYSLPVDHKPNDTFIAVIIEALLNLSLMLDVHVLLGIVERLTDIPNMDSYDTIEPSAVVSYCLPSTSTFIKCGGDLSIIRHFSCDFVTLRFPSTSTTLSRCGIW
ncbi:hypothetical protein L484_005342 [Morus notabilis]|uniref:Uncharacterized protein n=1 Tax=Morus notabilis TaxID=981085 RepID=W9R5F9_9ROSA|nr:hypothetical protein L484_005342 [Morus notabilis]